MVDRLWICLIYILLFILIYIFQKKAYESLRTPLTFFSLLWCIIGFFSNTTIMDYEQPSLFVNLNIILGIIVFTIVYIILVPKIKVKINNNWNFGKSEIINYKNILLINIVCWGFMALKLKTAINILKTEGFTFLRANLTNKEIGLSYGGVLDIISGYMIEPVFITTAILAFFLVFSKESKWKKILLLSSSILSIVVYAITSAARGCLVKIVFCFFFILLISKKKIILNIFKIKIIRYIMVFLIVMVLFITFQRGTFEGGNSSIESIFRTMYIYYFSGPAYMSNLIVDQPQYGGFGKLLFGSATFGFITSFYSWILIFFTGKNQGALYLLGSEITNSYYTVAPFVKINAMYTCFYTFWVDWGYLGLIIGPTILASFSAYLFKRVYLKRDYRSCIIYIFWLYILVRTVFKLDTIGVDITIVFICVRLFVRRLNDGKKYKEKFYL